MKPIKITAEVIIKPEDFSKWCDGDFPESEIMYEHYVYKVIHSKFGAFKDFGSLEDFINTTIPDNGNGLKLTIEELE